MDTLHSALEISTFLDILQGLKNIYNDLPVPIIPQTADSLTARQTAYNLYNHLSLQLIRAGIDLGPHIPTLLETYTQVIAAIHKAHGTITTNLPHDTLQ